MKTKKTLLLCAVLFYSLLLSATLPEGYPETNRKKQNINLDWAFSKMPEGEKPVSVNFNDSQWQRVALPHNPDPVSLWLDSTTQHWTQETFLRDHSWYRKQLLIELEPDEKAFLEFEGVHNATELWVNGRFVGRHDINGYIPHHFDITEFVEPGKENVIVVHADNSFDPTIAPDPHRTDYVKWAGIYRDVYLVKTNKLHVNFNWEAQDAGVHITTPSVKHSNGTVSVKTTVVNEHNSDTDCRIETLIIDAAGYVLKKLNQKAVIRAGGQTTFRQTTDITDGYHRWSPDHPYLYRALSVVYLNGEAVDYVENRFGFRSVELRDGEGLILNGAPFFMTGVNRHQNYPHIGDAVPNSMHYEAALRYKEAGINAIRLSHYPQDDSFIEACDELGILLYEEPSTWIEWEQGEWMEKLEQSTRVMIRNHRNHPSIIIWGAGINHRGPVPQLHNAAKEEDPWRFTASSSSPWSGVKNAGVTDIYATMDYRRTDFPEGDFGLLMEHGFTPDSRGQQHHISRYKKRKNNIGTLLWVGADYNHLRERPDKHDMFTEYGLQTIYRVPRPAYYWYKSELTATPFVHIADASAYKNQKVHVYSNAQQVALYADDQLIAIQTADRDELRNRNEHPSFTFHYNWTTEKLTARALNFGKEQAVHSRTKAGKPYALKLAVDQPDLPLQAGGSDLKMIRAYVLDENGEVVTDAEVSVHFETEGAGRVLYANRPFIKNMQAFHGVATVYLQGEKEAGEISVQATAEGLKPALLTLNSQPFLADELSKNVGPVFDFPIYKIDIQQQGQLAQFGWKVETGGKAADFSFTTQEGATFSVRGDNPLQWRDGSHTIVGELGYMACDGLYTDSGKLYLTISGLPKGQFVLTSYHHSFENREKLFPYVIAVERNDANGDYAFTSDEEAVGIFDGKDIGERRPVSVTNYIESDGENPIIISFKTDKKEAATWLNGLEFRQIK